jgi:hypothetical protein
MKAYLIFNRSNGEILHAHTEATLEGEPRRVEGDELIETLVLARSEGMDRRDLDALEVEEAEIQAGKSGGVKLLVDPKKRTLVEREANPSG